MMHFAPGTAIVHQTDDVAVSSR
jgi:hypothetical protein